MRIALALILTIVADLALGFDCSVVCPNGFRGGCVKSESGCACSCREQAHELKSDILKSLESQGASADLLNRADKLLTSLDKVTETVLKDSESGKQFTIVVNKQRL